MKQMSILEKIKRIFIPTEGDNKVYNEIDLRIKDEEREESLRKMANGKN